jgi:hypothetical protein
MTRFFRSCARALAALPITAATLAGQVGVPSDNTAYGTTAGEFLLLGAGARGLALGGAFAALTTDVSALYYNPAGLAQLPHGSVMVSSNRYVADTKYTWAGLAIPVGGGSRAFGVQLGNFGFTDQPIYTVEQPDGTGGTYSVSETFVGASYAQNFSDRFSAGITAKFLSDKLGQVSGTAMAMDFGTSFHTQALGGRLLRASFVIQNLGTTLKHSGVPLDATTPRPPVPGQVDVPQENQPAALKAKDWGLPVLFRVGVALDALSQDMAKLTVLSEFTQPNNSRPGFSLGGEFTLSDIGKSGFSVVGRGSYAYQSDNNLDVGTGAGFQTTLGGQENRDGLAGGFGVGYKRPTGFGMGFDYAYRSLGVLGGTNTFSFSINW